MIPPRGPGRNPEHRWEKNRSGRFDQTIRSKQFEPAAARVLAHGDGLDFTQR
jgi:hypothetical protein